MEIDVHFILVNKFTDLFASNQSQNCDDVSGEANDEKHDATEKCSH